MNKKLPIYVSIDVESDGPIPGVNSMLSFGAAAFRLDSIKPINTFEANLELLPDAIQSKSTMDWWKTQPKAWDACRKDQQNPGHVMRDFVKWINSLDGRVTLIGYPVTFDFMYIYWYTMAFGGLKDGERCPYGFQGLDIKTLAAEKMGVEYKMATKKNMPKHWFKGCPKHTHVALDDAIGQGVLFVNMKNEKVDHDS